jgi:hypothetical protein
MVALTTPPLVVAKRAGILRDDIEFLDCVDAWGQADFVVLVFAVLLAIQENTDWPPRLPLMYGRPELVICAACAWNRDSRW